MTAAGRGRVALVRHCLVTLGGYALVISLNAAHGRTSASWARNLGMFFGRPCSALVFLGEDDFGIVMAEALACGTPVIAFGRGGAREVVTGGETGVLFADQTAGGLRHALGVLSLPIRVCAFSHPTR
jgi:hypothetical protein